MFFQLRRAPVEIAAAQIQGLRISLNTPVVSGNDLPVGPARAAIVLHDDADGRPGVTVGVRSLKTGQVALYSYEGDLFEDSSIAVGTDAALSFGEGMGFLFDDDEVRADAPQTREVALGLWAELMGAGRAPALPAAEPPVPLDEEPILDLSEEWVAEPQPSPEPARKAPLSKFRRGQDASEPPEAEERPARGAALGRLKLIKRRRGNAAAAEDRRSFVRRLRKAF